MNEQATQNPVEHLHSLKEEPHTVEKLRVEPELSSLDPSAEESFGKIIMLSVAFICLAIILGLIVAKYRIKRRKKKKKESKMNQDIEAAGKVLSPKSSTHSMANDDSISEISKISKSPEKETDSDTETNSKSVKIPKKKSSEKSRGKKKRKSKSKSKEKGRSSKKQKKKKKKRNSSNSDSNEDK